MSVRWIFLAACLAILPAVSGPAAAGKTAGGGGSCAECHRGLKGPDDLKHTYPDWKRSVHAAAGVGCEACHGGDPVKTGREAAHAGVLPSSQPGSPVYFTVIPKTCGVCHAKELAAFRRSVHYRELQTSGRGPNCVTCHGAMASRVLEPKTMEMTCTLCHRRPTQAYAARMSLTHSADQVRRLGRAVERGRQAGVDVTAQARELADLTARQARAVVDWHTFDMAGVLGATQAVSRRAATATNELKLKGAGE
ncbi:MAG: hypothetical protein AAB152_05375 [Candidatus Coatesbacteria bacterium]